MQFAATLRNNRISQVGSTIGAAGTLKIYTGSPPGVGNATTGTLLCTLTALTFGAAAGGAVAITAAPDNSAAASGTPGYFRFASSGGTVSVEGSAGVGTSATVGTVTVAGGAVTAVPLGIGGSGYPAISQAHCLVSGGGGNGAIVIANIAGGAVTGYTIVAPGFNYATPPTITPPGPYELTLNQAVSLNGNVSLTSGTLTEGNA